MRSSELRYLLVYRDEFERPDRELRLESSNRIRLGSATEANISARLAVLSCRGTAIRQTWPGQRHQWCWPPHQSAHRLGGRSAVGRCRSGRLSPGHPDPPSQRARRAGLLGALRDFNCGPWHLVRRATPCDLVRPTWERQPGITSRLPPAGGHHPWCYLRRHSGHFKGSDSEFGRLGVLPVTRAVGLRQRMLIQRRPLRLALSVKRAVFRAPHPVRLVLTSQPRS